MAGLFDIGGLFTGPVGAILEIGDDKLKRQAIKSILSAGYSATITMLFETGRKKLWGEGKALQQTARSIWLSLQPLADAGLLSLDVPKDLMDPDELSKFQGEYAQKFAK